jgi:hypothetical protein
MYLTVESRHVARTFVETVIHVHNFYISVSVS